MAGETQLYLGDSRDKVFPISFILAKKPEEHAWIELVEAHASNLIAVECLKSLRRVGSRVPEAERIEAKRGRQGFPLIVDVW